MKLKNILSLTLMCGVSSLALCAEKAPAVIDCKIEKIIISNSKPSTVDFWRANFGFSEGEVVHISVNQLTESGGTYVLRGLRDKYDLMTINRADGSFDYAKGVDMHAVGHCKEESVKF